MLHGRCRLRLRNVEDLLFERGIDVCHETVRLWWKVRSAVRGEHLVAAGQPDAGFPAVALVC